MSHWLAHIVEATCRWAGPGRRSTATTTPGWYNEPATLVPPEGIGRLLTLGGKTFRRMQVAGYLLSSRGGRPICR